MLAAFATTDWLHKRSDAKAGHQRLFCRALELVEDLLHSRRLLPPRNSRLIPGNPAVQCSKKYNTKLIFCPQSTFASALPFWAFTFVYLESVTAVWPHKVKMHLSKSVCVAFSDRLASFFPHVLFSNLEKTSAAMQHSHQLDVI